MSNRFAAGIRSQLFSPATCQEFLSWFGNPLDESDYASEGEKDEPGARHQTAAKHQSFKKHLFLLKSLRLRRI